MTPVIIQMNLLTPSNIMFVLGILSIIFSIYNYFKNPQIDSDRKDALLAQQVQWTIEGNERRFTEIQANVKDAFLLASNHTHTVDVKVDKLVEQVNALNLGITKINTILEERLPKKI